MQRFLRIYTSTLSVYYNEMSLVIVQRPLVCVRVGLRVLSQIKKNVGEICLYKDLNHQYMKIEYLLAIDNSYIIIF